MAARAPAPPDLVVVIVAPGHTVDDGVDAHGPGALLTLPADQVAVLLQAGAVLPAYKAGGDAHEATGAPADES